jgi:glycosyltransferase involved in cell wall biosynthesis
MLNRRRIRILGIRGLPARHGGFETFTERLAPYLVERGWEVTVYCQEESRGPIRTDSWLGVRRVIIPSGPDTPLSTIRFDLASIRHAARHDDLCLTLGYNTAILTALLRVRGIHNILNMDGVEWKRSKWSFPAKAWFYINDWAGCLLSSHLIADNPHIKALVQRRTSASRISCIPYGTDILGDVSIAPLTELGLVPSTYLTVIARPEPENSLLQLVSAFSRRQRGTQLVVLGKLLPDNPYHQAVRRAASEEVVFLGEIYDHHVLASLRKHCIGYLHGHQVGGTNPSLLEAMGAGNAVLAHDSKFNRWVVADGALFFRTEAEADDAISRLIVDKDLRDRLARSSLDRAAESFTWESVLEQYRVLLARWAQPVQRDEFRPTAAIAEEIEQVRIDKSR